MKGNCNYQPAAIIEYGKTGTGQVLFNIERNDREVDGVLQENWDFDYCVVDNFRRETIIAGVIRSRYSQDAVEAIINSHLFGTDTGEFTQLQNWRNLAKAVADGTIMKIELDVILTVTDIALITEIDQTLQAVVETLIAKGITP